MVESSKRRKGSYSTSSARRHRDISDNPPPQPNPPITMSHILLLFANKRQYERYYSNFSNHDILEPKYFDSDFFNGENFDCYNVFQNTGLSHFITLNDPYFIELVQVFHGNCVLVMMKLYIVK